MRIGVRVGVLLSGRGRGSNMQALIDATRDGRIPGEVALVLSTSAEAPALARAAAADVPTCLIDAAESPDAAALDGRIADAFSAARVDVICLAGYMRLVGPPILSAYAGRLMNIHPALLPAFGGRGYYGRRLHEAVLAAGVKLTGVTVHFVDEEYDHGPIILQRAVPVAEDDTVDTLAARVLAEEHRAYPEAVRLYAEGRLRLDAADRRRVHVLAAPAEP